MSEATDAPQKVDLWVKIAGITFGLWSLAVPIGVSVVRDAVEKVSAAQQADRTLIEGHSVEIAVLRARVDELERRQRLDDEARWRGSNR